MISKEQFKRLPPKCQRMAVAKDVISQIEAKRYVAESGTYIYVVQCKPSVEEIPTLGDLYKRSERCHVCAIGALAMSCIQSGVSSVSSVGGQALVDSLKEIFDPLQLRLMEAAFERTPSGWYRFPGSDRDLWSRAASFALYTDNPDRRLLRIMRNVLENQGEFKP